MASIALSVRCHVVLFCFALFHVCVWLWCGFWTIWSVWGSVSFFLFIVYFIYCIYVYSLSSLGDVKGLLGMFHRCDHIDRVQVKGHGGVSSTFI